jgi:6-phosphogluconate dehydrogenase (decarboxylating)
VTVDMPRAGFPVSAARSASSPRLGARGDCEVLAARRPRAARIHLGKDIGADLNVLTRGRPRAPVPRGDCAMQVGIVGLGRMGGNMARRLMRAGHEVVAFATATDAIEQLAREGATGATSLGDFAAKLRPPRVAWVMVPAGAATEQVVSDLGARMHAGDAIIDGGNSFYKDDVRRMKLLQRKGIHYLDVGTSGGVWGLERGYCLMIGGDADVVRRLDPIWKALAPGNREHRAHSGTERSAEFR